MGQSIILKCKGLITNPNNLGSLPDGALTQADNVYIDRPDTAEPRRGFKIYDTFGDDDDRAKQFLIYQDRLLRHYGSTLSYDSATGNGPFTDYTTGVNEVQDGIKIKSIELNGNLYITSSDGILKLDKVDGELSQAGGVKALDLDAVLGSSGGFFESDNQTGYRLVWGFKDNNNNLILGTPSERAVVVNDTPDSYKVDLTFSIPKIVTEDHFYQVYRTRLSGASGVDPGDEMALVFEGNPTPSEITNRVATITDVTSDDFRGAELYTNANQEGILQSNEVPPFAKDIAVYNNSGFYANTKTKFRLNLSMLSTASFTNSSTITISNNIDTFTLTFNNSSENATGGQVFYDTSGTPAQNVDVTARSLVRTINRFTDNDSVYAYYLSGPDDVPGQLIIESRNLGDTGFSLICDDSDTTGSEFNPILPESGTSVIANNEEIANKVYYSKSQQPDAVPLLNSFLVGSRNNGILRIVALRDSLFIFKKDGIYRAIGDAINGFQVSLFDNSTILIAPESPAVGNNQIYMLADQGVIKVSDTGVELISININNMLENLSSPAYTNFTTATFGFYYTVKQRYYLFTVQETSDETATRAIVYNYTTQTYTNLPIAKTCGIVHKNKVYLGAADINSIEEERKDFSYRDYADRQYDTALTSYSDNILAVGSVVNMNVGDILTQTVYLTPYKFNRVLAQLDIDPGTPSKDYLQTLEVVAKADLRAALNDLANKLDSDGLSHTNYFSSMTGSTLPSGVQSDFNIVVGLLNTDTVLTNADYPISNSTSTLETIITDINTVTNEITVEFIFDWDLNTVTYYNHIATSITWAPTHAGEASIFKQFRESNLMFSDIASNSISLSYRSDIQRGFETIDFVSDTTGAWGQFAWGDEPWGGVSNPKAFRTYIPAQKQRCRFLEPKFQHKRAYESFTLVGISLTFDPMTERIGR